MYYITYHISYSYISYSIQYTAPRESRQAEAILHATSLRLSVAQPSVVQRRIAWHECVLYIICIICAILCTLYIIYTTYIIYTLYIYIIRNICYILYTIYYILYTLQYIVQRIRKHLQYSTVISQLQLQPQLQLYLQYTVSSISRQCSRAHQKTTQSMIRVTVRTKTMTLHTVCYTPYTIY